MQMKRNFSLPLLVGWIAYSSDTMLPFAVRLQSNLPRKLTSAIGMYSSFIPQESTKYTKSYQLSGFGKGNRVEITTNTGHALTTDIPKKMGGTDSGPQPVETLIAAWMGCTQATAVFVGRHLPQRVVIDTLEFENIQGFRDERGALQLPIEKIPDVPSRLTRITGTIHVYARNTQPISSDQLHLLRAQTEIRCPVANMLVASGCTVDVEWLIGSRKT